MYLLKTCKRNRVELDHTYDAEYHIYLFDEWLTHVFEKKKQCHQIGQKRLG